MPDIETVTELPEPRCMVVPSEPEVVPSEPEVEPDINKEPVRAMGPYAPEIAEVITGISLQSPLIQTYISFQFCY